jgi:nucleoside phosphorylase
VRNNSKSIAIRNQGNKNVYNKFFESCDWVASAPGVFFWTGEHAVLSGALAICQQIPQRVYVGIKRLNRQDKFHLDVGQNPDDHMQYDHETGRFNPVTWTKTGKGGKEAAPILSDHLRTDFHDAVSEIARKLSLSGLYAFKSVHELRWSSGADWSGAFAAALTGALYSAAGRCNVETKWKDEWWHDPFLNEINADAWELDRIFHSPFASGYGVVCSTAPCSALQLYALRWRDSQNAGQDPSQRIDSNRRLIDFLEPIVMPFCRSLEWQRVASNFDVGLIFTGVHKNTSESIRRTFKLADEMSLGLELARSVCANRRYKPFAMQYGPMYDLLADNSKTYTKEMLHRLQMEALAGAGLRVLQTLSPILENEAIETQYLADALNSVNGGLLQLGLGWPEADLVRATVIRAFWHDRSRVAIKPTGGARGGYVVLFCPELEWTETGRPKPGNPSVELVRELDSLAKEHKLPISLDWIESRDGLDGDGLRIEKDTNGNMSNRFASIVTGRADFAVICPMLEEFDAVKAVMGLKEIPGKTSKRSYYSTYVDPDEPSGQRQHVVCDHSAQTGHLHFQNLVKRIIEDWHPKYILVVGIGGGVKQRGLQAGDVLISNYIEYYQLQKVSEGVKERRVTTLEPPAKALLDLVDNICRRVGTHFIQIEDAKRPDLQEWDKSNVLKGFLLAGETLQGDLDENDLRELLDRHTDAKAIDMESGSVGTVLWDVPQPRAEYVVIRGISDCPRSKSDKEDKTNQQERDQWRKAAAYAAAYVALAIIREATAICYRR